jgi:threonine aldolase
MAEAEVGDDVFGEDPTVNELQERVASMLGKERGLFVPSGVMGNQLAIKSHTQPGDEIILEQDAHIFQYETTAPAFISHVQVYTIPGKRGVITAEQIKKVIRSKAYYLPTTKLICLENTHNRAGGTIFPIDEMKRVHELAIEHGLKMHLDGARLWNASVASGISLRDYAQYFDSVSVCFSKGLGAPVGSVLCGNEDFIERAHRFRKILGGGMRQVGVLAAAGLHAIEHNIERLKEDHEKARCFADMVNQSGRIMVDLESVQTNIVIVDIERTNKNPEELLAALKERGVLLTQGGYRQLRAVMHLDVSMEEVQTAAKIIQEVM